MRYLNSNCELRRIRILLNVSAELETRKQFTSYILYIFGGGYKNGNALREGPEFLMSRNVILVMVTYRLGVLGLLSTGDSVIPGNMALKDQTLAMKWVNENIYEFGGDPHRVTIQGHSSGAMNVHLHTLSPLSRRTLYS